SDLVHAVRDEHDPDAVAAQAPDDPEQPVAGGNIKRRGRLVQDQDAWAAEQRAHDAAGLPVAERQLFDRGVEAERATEQLAERLPGSGALLAYGDAGAQEPVRTQPDVVEHRPGLGDEHLLEDRDDARLYRCPRVAQRRQKAPSELDLAGVRRMHTTQDLHERALAGAVLADERVHLSRPQLERRPPKGLCR